jgi:hypothetical protein
MDFVFRELFYCPKYKKLAVRHSGKQHVLRADFFVSYIGVVSIVNYDPRTLHLLQDSRLQKSNRMCFKAVIDGRHKTVY